MRKCLVISKSLELRIVGAHDFKITEIQEFCSSVGMGTLVESVAFRFTELLRLFFRYIDIHLFADGTLVGMGTIDLDFDNLVIGIAPYLVPEKDAPLFAMSDGGFLFGHGEVEFCFEILRYLCHNLDSILSAASNAKEKIVRIS